jgi:2-keto-4-pentenoate hydratase/2-oxohepta-3-ene-1,7-dioic acid hydratase in catechol pathway
MARFVTFSHAGSKSFGVVDEKFIVDLPGSFPKLSGTGLAAALRAHSPQELTALAKDGNVRLPLDLVQLEPPVCDGEKLLCVGLNFADHAREANLPVPSKPSLFPRFLSSFVGHGRPIIAPPPTVSVQFDYEGELAVVIARAGRHISEADAMQHVLGYTIVAENSVRDWQKHSTQATAGKNFFHSGAIGPWCITRDNYGDAAAFTIETRLNGEVVQRGSTADFIFTIPQIIAYVSSFAVLLPGDLISLGTPSGIGMSRRPPLWLKPGDILEIEIGEIGILRNNIVADTSPDETRQ